MGSIKVLSQDVVNKISAGEIVERPSSVVKELIENALDAGATQIVVELKNGGKKLIHVADNGCGMSKDDAELALKRYATSKISGIDDLEHISSYGFRGEALPSIGAVSRLVLTTRPKDSEHGTLIESEGGNIKKARDTGCGAGTTLMVRDLFYNTPARLKFIKSNTTETSHVSAIVVEQALANTDTSFKLVSNDREMMHIPAVSSAQEGALLERIATIYGKEMMEGLLPINFENKFLKISGFISMPAFSRGNKNQQFMFVNRRSIRSRLLAHAVYEGYHGFVTAGRHPVIFLFIDIDPTLVDVNVHPTKREVRFTNEHGIHELVNRLIRQTLASGNAIASIVQAEDEEAGPQRDKVTKIQEAIGEYLSKVDASSAKRLKLEDENMDLFENTKFVFSASGNQTLTIISDIIPIGQANNLYIIARDAEGLLIIDQHALSERILYEQFRRDYDESKIAFQDLLFPITLELGLQQAQIIKENIENFRRLGFEVENFGVNTFIVKTVPVLLGEYSDKQAILDIFDAISGSMKDTENIEDAAKHLSEEMLKLMACHGAVRGGDTLNTESIYCLLEGIDGLENIYTCPHGRPTMMRIGFGELEKRFKRK
ncbi:MAG: DNA mismatch repair endonuclease MutL [bacterium]